MTLPQTKAEATTRGRATSTHPRYSDLSWFSRLAHNLISVILPLLYLQSGRNHHFLRDLELVAVSQGRGRWGATRLVSSLGAVEYGFGDLNTRSLLHIWSWQKTNISWSVKCMQTKLCQNSSVNILIKVTKFQTQSHIGSKLSKKILSGWEGGFLPTYPHTEWGKFFLHRLFSLISCKLF